LGDYGPLFNAGQEDAGGLIEMFSGLRQKVVVQPGGVIEIHSPELPAGATVEVIVLLEPQAQPASQGLSQFIGAAQGNFATPAEVDQFIRLEREAWES
jgi:hypothetical protein